MSRFEILDNLVEDGNGYLCTSHVLANGISKPTLADYVNKRNMARVAHGVYLAEDAWPDELYQLFLSNRRIVFSHETALQLHGDVYKRQACTLCARSKRSMHRVTEIKRGGIDEKE